MFGGARSWKRTPELVDAHQRNLLASRTKSQTPTATCSEGLRRHIALERTVARYVDLALRDDEHLVAGPLVCNGCPRWCVLGPRTLHRFRTADSHIPEATTVLAQARLVVRREGSDAFHLATQDGLDEYYVAPTRDAWHRWVAYLKDLVRRDDPVCANQHDAQSYGDLRRSRASEEGLTPRSTFRSEILSPTKQCPRPAPPDFLSLPLDAAASPSFVPRAPQAAAAATTPPRRTRRRAQDATKHTCRHACGFCGTLIEVAAHEALCTHQRPTTTTTTTPGCALASVPSSDDAVFRSLLGSFEVHDPDGHPVTDLTQREGNEVGSSSLAPSFPVDVWSTSFHPVDARSIESTNAPLSPDKLREESTAGFTTPDNGSRIRQLTQESPARASKAHLTQVDDIATTESSTAIHDRINAIAPAAASGVPKKAEGFLSWLDTLHNDETPEFAGVIDFPRSSQPAASTSMPPSNSVANSMTNGQENTPTSRDATCLEHGPLFAVDVKTPPVRTRLRRQRTQSSVESAASTPVAPARETTPASELTAVSESVAPSTSTTQLALSDISMNHLDDTKTPLPVDFDSDATKDENGMTADAPDTEQAAQLAASNDVPTSGESKTLTAVVDRLRPHETNPHTSSPLGASMRNNLDEGEQQTSVISEPTRTQSDDAVTLADQASEGRGIGADASLAEDDPTQTRRESATLDQYAPKSFGETPGPPNNTAGSDRYDNIDHADGEPTCRKQNFRCGDAAPAAHRIIDFVEEEEEEEEEDNAYDAVRREDAQRDTAAGSRVDEGESPRTSQSAERGLHVPERYAGGVDMSAALGVATAGESFESMSTNESQARGDPPPTGTTSVSKQRVVAGKDDLIPDGVLSMPQLNTNDASGGSLSPTKYNRGVDEEGATSLTPDCTQHFSRETVDASSSDGAQSVRSRVGSEDIPGEVSTPINDRPGAEDVRALAYDFYRHLFNRSSAPDNESPDAASNSQTCAKVQPGQLLFTTEDIVSPTQPGDAHEGALETSDDHFPTDAGGETQPSSDLSVLSGTKAAITPNDFFSQNRTALQAPPLLEREEVVPQSRLWAEDVSGERFLSTKDQSPSEADAAKLPSPRSDFDQHSSSEITDPCSRDGWNVPALQSQLEPDEEAAAKRRTAEDAAKGTFAPSEDQPRSTEESATRAPESELVICSTNARGSPPEESSDATEEFSMNASPQVGSGKLVSQRGRGIASSDSREPSDDHFLADAEKLRAPAQASSTKCTGASKGSFDSGDLQTVPSPGEGEDTVLRWTENVTESVAAHSVDQALGEEEEEGRLKIPSSAPAEGATNETTGASDASVHGANILSPKKKSAWPQNLGDAGTRVPSDDHPAVDAKKPNQFNSALTQISVTNDTTGASHSLSNDEIVREAPSQVRREEAASQSSCETEDVSDGSPASLNGRPSNAEELKLAASARVQRSTNKTIETPTDSISYHGNDSSHKEGDAPPMASAQISDDQPPGRVGKSKASTITQASTARSSTSAIDDSPDTVNLQAAPSPQDVEEAVLQVSSVAEDATASFTPSDDHHPPKVEKQKLPVSALAGRSTNNTTAGSSQGKNIPLREEASSRSQLGDAGNTRRVPGDYRARVGDEKPTENQTAFALAQKPPTKTLGAIDVVVDGIGCVAPSIVGGNEAVSRPSRNAEDVSGGSPARSDEPHLKADELKLSASALAKRTTNEITDAHHDSSHGENIQQREGGNTTDGSPMKSALILGDYPAIEETKLNRTAESMRARRSVNKTNGTTNSPAEEEEEEATKPEIASELAQSSPERNGGPSDTSCHAPNAVNVQPVPSRVGDAAPQLRDSHSDTVMLPGDHSPAYADDDPNMPVPIFALQTATKTTAAPDDNSGTQKGAASSVERVEATSQPPLEAQHVLDRVTAPVQAEETEPSSSYVAQHSVNGASAGTGYETSVRSNKGTASPSALDAQSPSEGQVDEDAAHSTLMSNVVDSALITSAGAPENSSDDDNVRAAPSRVVLDEAASQPQLWIACSDAFAASSYRLPADSGEAHPLASAPTGRLASDTTGAIEVFSDGMNVHEAPPEVGCKETASPRPLEAEGVGDPLVRSDKPSRADTDERNIPASVLSQRSPIKISGATNDFSDNACVPASQLTIGVEAVSGSSAAHSADDHSPVHDRLFVKDPTDDNAARIERSNARLDMNVRKTPKSTHLSCNETVRDACGAALVASFDHPPADAQEAKVKASAPAMEFAEAPEVSFDDVNVNEDSTRVWRNGPASQPAYEAGCVGGLLTPADDRPHAYADELNLPASVYSQRSTIETTCTSRDSTDTARVHEPPSPVEGGDPASQPTIGVEEAAPGRSAARSDHDASLVHDCSSVYDTTDDDAARISKRLNRRLDMNARTAPKSTRLSCNETIRDAHSGSLAASGDCSPADAGETCPPPSDPAERSSATETTVPDVSLYGANVKEALAPVGCKEPASPGALEVVSVGASPVPASDHSRVHTDEPNPSALVLSQHSDIKTIGAAHDSSDSAPTVSGEPVLRPALGVESMPGGGLFEFSDDYNRWPEDRLPSSIVNDISDDDSAGMEQPITRTDLSGHEAPEKDRPLSRDEILGGACSGVLATSDSRADAEETNTRASEPVRRRPSTTTSGAFDVILDDASIIHDTPSPLVLGDPGVLPLEAEDTVCSPAPSVGDRFCEDAGDSNLPASVPAQRSTMRNTGAFDDSARNAGDGENPSRNEIGGPASQMTTPLGVENAAGRSHTPSDDRCLSKDDSSRAFVSNNADDDADSIGRPMSADVPEDVRLASGNKTPKRSASNVEPVDEFLFGRRDEEKGEGSMPQLGVSLVGVPPSSDADDIAANGKKLDQTAPVLAQWRSTPKLTPDASLDAGNTRDTPSPVGSEEADAPPSFAVDYDSPARHCSEREEGSSSHIVENSDCRDGPAASQTWPEKVPAQQRLAKSPPFGDARARSFYGLPSDAALQASKKPSAGGETLDESRDAPEIFSTRENLSLRGERAPSNGSSPPDDEKPIEKPNQTAVAQRRSTTKMGAEIDDSSADRIVRQTPLQVVRGVVSSPLSRKKDEITSLSSTPSDDRLVEKEAKALAVASARRVLSSSADDTADATAEFERQIDGPGDESPEEAVPIHSGTIATKVVPKKDTRPITEEVTRASANVPTSWHDTLTSGAVDNAFDSKDADFHGSKAKPRSPHTSGDRGGVHQNDASQKDVGRDVASNDKNTRAAELCSPDIMQAPTEQLFVVRAKREATTAVQEVASQHGDTLTGALLPSDGSFSGDFKEQKLSESALAQQNSKSVTKPARRNDASSVDVTFEDASSPNEERAHPSREETDTPGGSFAPSASKPTAQANEVKLPSSGSTKRVAGASSADMHDDPARFHLIHEEELSEPSRRDTRDDAATITDYGPRSHKEAAHDTPPRKSSYTLDNPAKDAKVQLVLSPGGSDEAELQSHQGDERINDALAPSDDGPPAAAAANMDTPPVTSALQPKGYTTDARDDSSSIDDVSVHETASGIRHEEAASRPLPGGEDASERLLMHFFDECSSVSQSGGPSNPQAIASEDIPRSSCVIDTNATFDDDDSFDDAEEEMVLRSLRRQDDATSQLRYEGSCPPTPTVVDSDEDKQFMADSANDATRFAPDATIIEQPSTRQSDENAEEVTQGNDTQPNSNETSSGSSSSDINDRTPTEEERKYPSQQQIERGDEGSAAGVAIDEARLMHNRRSSWFEGLPVATQGGNDGRVSDHRRRPNRRSSWLSALTRGGGGEAADQQSSPYDQQQKNNRRFPWFGGAVDQSEPQHNVPTLWHDALTSEAAAAAASANLSGAKVDAFEEQSIASDEEKSHIGESSPSVIVNQAPPEPVNVSFSRSREEVDEAEVASPLRLGGDAQIVATPSSIFRASTDTAEKIEYALVAQKETAPEPNGTSTASSEFGTRRDEVPFGEELAQPLFGVNEIPGRSFVTFDNKPTTEAAETKSPPSGDPTHEAADVPSAAGNTTARSQIKPKATTIWEEQWSAANIRDGGGLTPALEDAAQDASPSDPSDTIVVAIYSTGAVTRLVPSSQTDFEEEAEELPPRQGDERIDAALAPSDETYPATNTEEPLLASALAQQSTTTVVELDRNDEASGRLVTHSNDSSPAQQAGSRPPRVVIASEDSPCSLVNDTRGTVDGDDDDESTDAEETVVVDDFLLLDLDEEEQKESMNLKPPLRRSLREDDDDDAGTSRRLDDAAQCGAEDAPSVDSGKDGPSSVSSDPERKNKAHGGPTGSIEPPSELNTPVSAREKDKRLSGKDFSDNSNRMPEPPTKQTLEDDDDDDAGVPCDEVVHEERICRSSRFGGPIQEKEKATTGCERRSMMSALAVAADPQTSSSPPDDQPRQADRLSSRPKLGQWDNDVPACWHDALTREKQGAVKDTELESLLITLSSAAAAAKRPQSKEVVGPKTSKKCDRSMRVVVKRGLVWLLQVDGAMKKFVCELVAVTFHSDKRTYLGPCLRYYREGSSRLSGSQLLDGSTGVVDVRSTRDGESALLYRFRVKQSSSRSSKQRLVLAAATQRQRRQWRIAILRVLVRHHRLLATSHHRATPRSSLGGRSTASDASELSDLSNRS